MAIKLNKKTNGNGIFTASYAGAKRAYPLWRWIFIVTVISIPLIYLFYVLFQEVVLVRAKGLVTFDTVTIRAPANGFVKTLDVRETENVSAGQLLLNFESPEVNSKQAFLQKEIHYLQNNLNGSENKVIQTLESMRTTIRKNINDSLDHYQKFENFRKQGDINEVFLESARLNYVKAQIELKELNKNIDQSKLDYKNNQERLYSQRLRQMLGELKQLEALKQYFLLSSPEPGTVASIQTYDKEFVPEGQPLLTIITRKNLRIMAFIEPKYAEDVYQHKEVTVIFPDRSYITGTIANIPSYSQKLPSFIINPLATPKNYLVVVIKPKRKVPKQFQVFGVPVEVDFK